MSAKAPAVFKTARDAAKYLQPLFCGSRERVIVAHLDSDQRLLGLTRVEGVCDKVDLPIRLIVAAALTANARSMVVAHNHPRGDPTPSDVDRDATLRLAQVVAPLEIRLQDHLVFTGDRCTSFRALGWL